MKKKIFLAILGTALIAAFAFSGFSLKASSLQELKAKAGGGCTPTPLQDCISGATGNIYVGYEAFSF